jgi:hypothetical protein
MSPGNVLTDTPANDDHVWRALWPIAELLCGYGLGLLVMWALPEIVGLVTLALAAVVAIAVFMWNQSGTGRRAVLGIGLSIGPFSVATAHVGFQWVGVMMAAYTATIALLNEYAPRHTQSPEAPQPPSTRGVMAGFLAGAALVAVANVWIVYSFG